MNAGTLTSLCAAGLLLWSAGCSVSVDVAGGGTIETTNGIVAAFCYADGRPAGGATVRLRPASYRAPASPVLKKGPVLDSYTDTLDAAGVLTVDSVRGGAYCLEISDRQGHALAIRLAVVYDDSVIQLGVDTLRQVAVVSGHLEPDTTALYVHIHGLERVIRADSLTGGFEFTDLPAGSFEFSVSADDPLVPGPATSSPVVLDPADTLRLPRFFAWPYAVTFALNTTASGADVATNVFNFPMAVRLNTGNFNFATARTRGADLRFLKADSSLLSYEIERWDSAGGFALVWVRMDTIWGSCDTQRIIMLWGNPTAKARSNSTAVFDTTEGFQAVWHLNDIGHTVPVKDATANRFDGVQHNTVYGSLVNGAVGKSRQFNGVSGYIEFPGTATGKINFPANGTFTFSLWVNPNALDSSLACLMSKGWFQHYFSISDRNYWEFSQFKPGASRECVTAAATAQAWTHLVAVRNGATQSLYVNGILVDDSVEQLPHDSGTWDASHNWTLARGTTGDGTDVYFNGKIDEVRIQSTALSADWIKLCYMSQRPQDRLVRVAP